MIIIKYIVLILIVTSVILGLSDLVDSILNFESYPIGSDFFSKYSIYSNEMFFYSYHLVRIFIGVIAIYFFKKKPFYFLSILFFILFLYPIFVIQ